MNEVDQFTAKELCNFTGRLQDSEEILCVGGSPSELFIGTNQGRIVHVKHESGAYKVKGILELPQKSPIIQIEDASAVDIILLVCDEILFELSKETYQFIGQHLNVTRFALNLIPDDLDDPFTLQLVISHPNSRIDVCRLKNNKLDTVQKIAIPGQVIELVYSRKAICYGTSSSYYVCNLETRDNIQLFPFDDKTSPSICVVDANDFLLNGMDGLAVYVNSMGMSTRPPIMLEKGCSMLASKGNIIFALVNSTIHIVSTETMKTIQLIEIEYAESFCILDGCLFVIAKEKLHQISPVEFESIIKSLMEEKADYEAVIAMFEQKDIEKLNDEQLEHLYEAKRKLAFKFLSEEKYERAEEIFNDLQIDPTSIISELEVSNSIDKHTDFLIDYIQRHRKKNIWSGLDEILFELLLKQSRILEMMNIESFQVDKDLIQKLVDKEFLHAAACLYWDSKEKESAIEIWISLLEKLTKDDMLNLDDIFKRLEIEANIEILIKILPSLITYDIDRVFYIIKRRKISPLKVSKFLKSHKTHYREYLESWKPQEDVRAELAQIYLEDIKGGKNDTRQKLRQILLDADEKILENVEKELPKAKAFAVEYQLLAARKNPEEAFSKVVNELKDYDAAELMCTKWPNLTTKLLDAYLTSEREEHMPRILHLLETINPKVNAKEIIQRLPSNIELSKIDNFLLKSMHSKLSEDNVNSLKERLIEVALRNNNLGGKLPPVRIDENSSCPVCHELLSFDSSITYLRTGFVVHTNCVKNPHICPVTGK